MTPRFDTRKKELLAECQLSPDLFADLQARLADFAKPLAARLHHHQRSHAHSYLQGLLSDLERKNAESIAYHLGQEREGLQHFVGTAPWDHQPLLDELHTQVVRDLGHPDGVLVLDPSAFPKKGSASVGVARQWCGRLGKIDNCQVGVFLAYVGPEEHALVDFRLYLPKEWTQDRKRCQKVGVPKEHIRYRTRHQLALEMLDHRGRQLPHGWIVGDDEMGRSSRFRQELRTRHERYLLAVPANTTIRDLEAEPPVWSGRGRCPKPPFVSIQSWRANSPETAWTKVEVPASDKGPRHVEVIHRRVQARTEGRKVGPEELLVLVRQKQEDGTWKYDDYLSNASVETPRTELARAAKAGHRIEECLQRGKSEAGLADYEVRTWQGWHHHITLSLLASWFLVQETRRGKQWAPAVTVPQIRTGLAKLLRQACGCDQPERIAQDGQRRLERSTLARFYHYKRRKLLAPLRGHPRR